MKEVRVKHHEGRISSPLWTEAKNPQSTHDRDIQYTNLALVTGTGSGEDIGMS